jgi:hypothetical protein
MRFNPRTVLLAASATAILASCLAPIQTASGQFRRPTTVEKLARSIDKLECHIDEYGSVVAKQPDVWGEARLTKHREDYEKRLKGQLDGFKDTINASISRADSALLLQTLALQAALGGRRAAIIEPSGTTLDSRTATTTMTETTGKEQVHPANQQTATTTTDKSSTENKETTQQERKTGTTTGGQEVPKAPTFTITTIAAAASPQQKIGNEIGGVALEPTLHLDQLSRYLNHLNQLRRINEGDDTSDSPGYSLNLVRIPVSVLPGKKTRIGYGAEVTITAEPYLSDALLPSTFKNLVANDLIESLALPITQFLNNVSAETYDEIADSFTQVYIFEQILDKLFEKRRHPSNDELVAFGFEPSSDKHVKWFLNDWKTEITEADIQHDIDKLKEYIMKCDSIDVCMLLKEYYYVSQPCACRVTTALKGLIGAFDRITSALGNESISAQEFARKKAIEGFFEENAIALKAIATDNTARTSVGKLDGLLKFSGLRIPAIGTTRNRNGQLPISPSQLAMVYGLHGLGQITDTCADATLPPQDTEALVHLMDARTFLSEEIASAYAFLESPENMPLWNFCTEDLYKAVRSGDPRRIASFRRQFRMALACNGRNHDIDYSTTGALAWNIIVVSALLNARLIEDMQAATVSKNYPSCCTSSWMSFFLPEPRGLDATGFNLEAKEAFKQYVRCRWPIHVFALDPVTQDQNIADSFTRRRELQLALSLAFATGKMSAQSFTQYSRRLDLDEQTIALNRTVIGFSHGDDTFGWRFYPRVQTPDTPSNATVFFRDLLVGGPTRDQELKSHRLEPGERECTAIVIMPSFVPYLLFNTRTNWFCLTNPKKKEFNLESHVGLSADITCLHQLASSCVREQHLYRDGEVQRLCKAVQQLDRRLPLQSAYVQIPFENTLGGFEMFNTGTTDLAPELKGFYGEPGVRTDVETDIFLVGDHFSVHETKVIAGNRLVLDDKKTLLSRQVMKITIPAKPEVVGKGDKFVDIHVATPYGVSNHLLVPAIAPPAAATADEVKKTATDIVNQKLLSRFEWKEKELHAHLFYDCNGKVCRFSFEENALNISDKSDFPDELRSPFARLMLKLVAVDKGGKQQAIKTIIPIDPLEFKNGNGGVHILDRLQGPVETAVKAGLFESFGAVRLEIVGYLRFCEKLKADDPTSGHQDALPIIRIDGTLVIQIAAAKDCERPCPPTMPPSNPSAPGAAVQLPAQNERSQQTNPGSSLHAPSDIDQYDDGPALRFHPLPASPTSKATTPRSSSGTSKPPISGPAPLARTGPVASSRINPARTIDGPQRIRQVRYDVNR